MSLSSKTRFKLPDILDEKDDIESGSIFKKHRQEVLLNTKAQPSKKESEPVDAGRTNKQPVLMPETSKNVDKAQGHTTKLGPQSASSGRIFSQSSAGLVTKAKTFGLQSSGIKSTEVTQDNLAAASNDNAKAIIGTSSGNAISVTNEIIDQGSSSPNKEMIAPPMKQIGSGNSLIVSARQRGNPILKFVRNVPWEYGDIVADYQMGKTSCALFLSLRYHNLNPNYIHERLKRLGHSYDLRVLLVQVDVKDPHHALKELAQICLLSDTTLILAFSVEEAGRYLETFKAYENKPPDLIMEKTESNFLSQFTDCITSTKKVNKTDAITLLTTFGSFAEITKQSEENLSLCPGFGPNKAKRLSEVINEPFLKSKKKTKTIKHGEKTGPKPGTSSSDIT